MSESALSPPGGGTILYDNATPRVISPAGVPGDAVELPNGDLSRSLFSVGVSGDVAAGVPGVSAGGVSGVVVAVVPGSDTSGSSSRRNQRLRYQG